jgi:hypothetical protein
MPGTFHPQLCCPAHPKGAEGPKGKANSLSSASFKELDSHLTTQDFLLLNKLFIHVFFYLLITKK